MVKWFWLVAYVFIIVFTTPHNFQDKYYLAEKEALEKFRKKYKEKYDTKAETFKKEVNWSIKRKKKKKTREGYIAGAVQINGVISIWQGPPSWKSSDSALIKAIKLRKRCYNQIWKDEMKLHYLRLNLSFVNQVVEGRLSRLH